MADPLNTDSVQLAEVGDESDDLGKGPHSPSIEVEDDPEPPVPDIKAKIPFKSYLVGICCIVTGLLFGYEIGGAGGTFVMEHFQDHMKWEKDADGELTNKARDEMGWIGALFSIGSVCGALPSGWISDHLGRKWLIIASNSVNIFGCILQFISINIGMLYSGRLISGAGIGMLTCLNGIYVAETAEFRIRGFMLTLFQLCTTFGIFVAGACNLGFRQWTDGWRFSYGGNSSGSVILIIIMFFLPESPRYKFMKGKTEDCEKILRNLRASEEEVTYEMWSLRQQARDDGEGVGSWADVFSCKTGQCYRTMLGMSLQFFQQWSGIGAVMGYAPTMIETFASANAALAGNMVIQLVNFFATFIAVFTVEKGGRIPLFLSGGLGMAFSLWGVGLLAAPYTDQENNTGVAVSIVLFIVFFVIFFSYSWGPLAWVVCSEIHTNRVRGKAVSLSTATGSATAAVVGKITPFMMDKNAFDLWGTFIFFGVWGLLMFFWIWFMCPETKGVKLEELDDLFNDFKPGRIKREKWIPPSQRTAEEKVEGNA